MARSSRSTVTIPLASLLALVAAGCGVGQLRGAGEPEPDRPGTSITARDIEGRPAARVEEVMVGKFSGVQVFQGPEGLVVRIRGVSSVYSNNDPLYVIDDMVVQPGPGGALVGLNPSDIEKIEVLKDIGQTARWGVQGANGVVLVTTKRGRN
jgi:TonB-dependent SusC/RagA subfamily outer membrane receptor